MLPTSLSSLSQRLEAIQSGKARAGTDLYMLSKPTNASEKPSAPQGVREKGQAQEIPMQGREVHPACGSDRYNSYNDFL